MPFREDILRGVRLFAIAFAAILLCVAAYRMLRSPAGVRGAVQEPSAAPDTAQPAPAAAVADAAAEPHPLVVPPPPSAAAAPAPAAVTKLARQKLASGVPPPPPLARASRTAAPPSGRAFESSQPGVLSSAAPEESPDSTSAPPKSGVGYKSLIEANANRSPDQPAVSAPPSESDEKPKGNRFFRAVGKIFRPGPKKETTPLTQKSQKPQ